MAFPDHLLTLATLRLLTLTPLAATYTPSTNTSSSTTSAIHHHHPPQDRFHSVRSRPLHILTELTAAYIQLLGSAAKNHAEQAGRSSANALDAREAVADYGGAVEEIDEWARECQLDRGILSSNDALLNDAAGAAAAGVEGERAEATDLGALLKDTYSNQAYRRPTKVIEYAPLTDREAAIVDAVQQNQSLLPFLPYDLQQRVQQGQDDTISDEEDHAPSPASSSRGLSQPPPSYQEATANTALSQRKREKLRAQDDDYNDHGENKENDDPLSFLPPFPDLDATHASLQTIVEDETGRIVKRARRALDANSNMANLSQARKNASIAWLRAVPYETSSLAEYEGGKFSIPSIKDEATSHRAGRNGELVEGDGQIQDEDDESFNASSLPYFLETFNWVSLDYEQQGDQALLPLRHNNKRKRAATAIQSNILNPSDDSLSGSIPALPPRYGKKQAGWIPYPPINPDISDSTEPGGKAIKPLPNQLNPFTTNLPNSITETIPNLILPHSNNKLLLSTSMHPRYSLIINSIKTLLDSNLPFLFNRTTRMGPPGPLLENGSNGNYLIEAEKPIIPGWPADALPRMMGWNFDWEIGNELEDGINERKNAGIQDFGDHPSSSSSAGNDATAGASTSSTPHNTYTNGNNSNTNKEEYTGPSFPALPTRPIYDPQQAIQQREREEAEFQFQEVEENKEIEASAALDAIRLQQEQEAQAHAQEEARLAAAVAAATAQREEAENKQREAALIQKEQTEPETSAAINDRPKALPKLSFSLKLGNSTTSLTPAVLPSTTASSLDASNASIPSEGSNPAVMPQEVASSSLPEDTQVLDQQGSTLHSESTDNLSQSGNTMWTPGISVEQDYRMPAADITSLSQPPILLPDDPTPVESDSPSVAVAEPTAPTAQLSSTPAAPLQSVYSPVAFGTADTFSIAEASQPEPNSGHVVESAEGDAEGEEDAENEEDEEDEEDDLFDEVEVVNAGEENGSLQPDFRANGDKNAGDSGMHVEVEEMDM